MGKTMIRMVRAALALALVFTACGAWAQNTPDCSSGSKGTCAFQGATYTYVGAGTSSLTQSFLNALQGGSIGPNNTFSAAPGTQRFALGKGDTGQAGAASGSNWNAWLSYSQSNVAYQFQPLQSSGRVNVSLVGVDYTFSNNLLIGLAGAWDQTRIGTSFNNGNFSSNGSTLAPYLDWRITPAWTLDASLGWGRANANQVDNSTGVANIGTFTDKRALGSLSLSYAKVIDKWQLTGRGSYLAGQDKISQFTLTTGVTIPSATVNNAQLRVGGQAMYNGGVLLPYLGVYYFNNVQQPSVAITNGQTPANARDGVLVQLGVQFAPKGPVYGGVMFSTTQGQSQIKNDMVMGNIGIRF